MDRPLLIDISRLLRRLGEGRLPTGVDRVCLAYIERWGVQARAIVQWHGWRRIFPYAQSQALFGLLLAPPPGLRNKARWQIARACVPPWPSQDAGDAFALHLGHSGVDQPGFMQWLRATRQRPVYFVHDLIPLTHPEYCRPGEGEVHERRLRVMLSTGAGLVANSAHTLDEVQAFAAARGLPVPPACVAHLAPAGFAEGAGPGDAPPLAAPYFVALGTIEPRKNHLLLLNLWRDIALRQGSAAPHLVVIGQRGWECENVVDMLERCVPLRGLVHEIPSCSDADLARWLRHARAMLFPSFAEGYGMPLVEALRLQTPVIASDLPVFREIAPGVPLLLDPLDGPAWRQAIDDYSRPQSAARAAQCEAMASLGLPGWPAHFQAVDSFLRQLG